MSDSINNLHIKKIYAGFRVCFFASFFLFGFISQAYSVTQADAEFAASQSISQDPSKLNPERLIHQNVKSDLDVPPVFQRPLGVEAGERIHVRRFQVNGVVSHPEFGINQVSVDNFVEKLRIEIQNLNVMNEFGLSEDDMKSMAKQLQESLYEEDEEVALKKHAEFRKKLKQAKKYREEMSIGQLQEVANKLTDFYRNSGLVIAQVFVPEQTVEDGVVNLRVLEGTLGGSVVEGNSDYSVDLLKSPFSHLEHKPVTKEGLENALLVLSDFPGLIAYGVLQPGAEQGETDLLVKVQEEIKNEYSVKLDNYGSETTGQNRLTFLYNRNNVFGNADTLDVNLLQTFTPANTIYGGVDYSSPIGFSGYDAGVGFSSNAFDVGGNLSGFNINGTVFATQLSLARQMERSRRSNYKLKLDFVNRIAETHIGSALLSKDIVTSLGFDYIFDNLDVVNQGINQGNVKLAFGLPGVLDSLDANNSAKASRTGGSAFGGNKAISDFTKLTWTVARLQLLDKYQNILVKTTGQFSPDLLPPVEQFGMGGPNNVRAFTTSEFLRDSAIFFSFEWNFNAPGFYSTPAFDGWKWGEILQVSAFVDYAIGTINEHQPSDIERLDIGGVGIAAQLVLPGQYTVRFDISTPFDEDDDDSTRPTDQADTLRSESGFQFYLTYTYTGF